MKGGEIQNECRSDRNSLWWLIFLVVVAILVRVIDDGMKYHLHK
jgi:hypothetical protein